VGGEGVGGGDGETEAVMLIGVDLCRYLRPWRSGQR